MVSCSDLVWRPVYYSVYDFHCIKYLVVLAVAHLANDSGRAKVCYRFGQLSYNDGFIVAGVENKNVSACVHIKYTTSELIRS
jgi:hypothetical protein